MASHTASTDTSERINSIRSITYALLRIGGGLLFMQHGAQKLFGILGGNQVSLFSQLGFAGFVEFFGGILIAIGLVTRPVAVLSAILMVAAYFVGHIPHGAVPIMNGGELAMLYALLFAAVAAHGPGKWSMDRKVLPKLA